MHILVKLLIDDKIHFYLHFERTFIEDYFTAYFFYAYATLIYLRLVCLLEFKIKLLISVRGPRIINILMKRGGSALRRHMIRILAECRLQDTEFRRANIDEQGTVLIDVVKLYCLNMIVFLELSLPN